MRRLSVFALVCGCWVNNPTPASAPAPLVTPPRDPHKRRDSLFADREDGIVLADRLRVRQVCVDGRGRLAVDGSATLEVVGSGPIVIAGRGIGSVDQRPAMLRLLVRDGAEIFVLFDNQNAAVTVDFVAPKSTIHIAITGQAGLTVNGNAKEISYSGGYGLPSDFPHCAR